MFKEFKEFALKGNALDLAVGIIIGAAFTAVVNSLVADVLTPPLALLQSGVKSFTEIVIPLGEGQEGIKIGSFINSVIQFLLTSFAVFLLVRAVNRFRRKEEADAPKP